MDQRWGVGAASPANGGTFQPLRSGTLTRFPIRLSMYAGADLQSIPGDGRYLQSSVHRFAAFFLSASVSFSACLLNGDRAAATHPSSSLQMIPAFGATGDMLFDS
jgi:hypothetical protein